MPGMGKSCLSERRKATTDKSGKRCKNTERTAPRLAIGARTSAMWKRALRAAPTGARVLALASL